MKDETKTAIDESILYWEENLASAKAGTLRVEDISDDVCALCIRFPGCATWDGERCPIYIETGSSGCKKSPWVEVDAALEERFRGGKSLKSCDRRLVKAVKAELNFLKSLREAGE